MNVQTECWPRPHRLTVHEYYRMAEVGLLSPGDRTELIEGEIIEMPPIGDRHAAAVRLLNTRLVRAVGDAAEVSTQLPVRLSLLSEPQPDFAIVKAKPGGYRKHPLPGDVLLLIEVSDSTLSYDLEHKARLYAAYGIREYWVVDLVKRCIVRHRAPGRTEYRERDDVRSLSLPLPALGVEISLAGLF